MVAGSKIFNGNLLPTSSLTRTDQLRVDLFLNNQLDENGILLEDYFHFQPSPLAHLVNGTPINGFDVFKTEKGITLRSYLKKTAKRVKPWY